MSSTCRGPCPWNQSLQREVCTHCADNVLGTPSWDAASSKWEWESKQDCSFTHPAQGALAQVLHELQIRRVKLIGDSVLRRFYFTLVAMLKQQQRLPGDEWYSDVPPQLRSRRSMLKEICAGVLVAFEWAPSTEEVSSRLAEQSVARWDCFIVNSGAWVLEDIFNSAFAWNASKAVLHSIRSELSHVDLSRPFHVPLQVRAHITRELSVAANRVGTALMNFSSRAEAARSAANHSSHGMGNISSHVNSSSGASRDTSASAGPPLLFFLQLGGLGFDMERILQYNCDDSNSSNTSCDRTYVAHMTAHSSLTACEA